MSARSTVGVRGSSCARVVGEAWLVHAMQRGYHVKFANDKEAERRVRLWKQECECEQEPCILIDEQGWQARIEVWMPGSESPIAYRGHVNDAPTKAVELAAEFGAWRVRTPVVFEPIGV